LLASKRQLQLSGKFQQDIVTLIEPAGDYYRADQSHQQYFEKKQARSVADLQKKI
jgi:peptide-methionine (S)-S-oxide reductase